MEGDSGSISQEFSQSSMLALPDGTLVVDHTDSPIVCAICQRIISSDNEAGDLEAISMCGDCKFLFLEDVGTPIQDAHWRRTRRRRTWYSSAESIEDLLSQHFPHVISLARQNQPSVPEHENQSLDEDIATRLVQHSSSRTTPSGSRRWRRILSDTESDGFDSLYGGSESHVSLSGYRHFHGDSDTVSFSAYGYDSDASVDAHSFLDNDIFGHPDLGNDLDSNTDIDPMNAGMNRWNSDQEEEEDDDDDGNDEESNQWEEVDAEESTVESMGLGTQFHRSLISSQNEVPLTWSRQLYSPETSPFRIRERRQTYVANILNRRPYVGNSGDYVDARGFEELLDRLTDTDRLRRGAPPAAISFVSSLPRIVVDKEHGKLDDLACAICKDSLPSGIEVNKLPCSHLYHPSCILPWLNARNTCPLCRYELPTDDKDYEERKQNTINGLEIHEIQHDVVSEDSLSSVSIGAAEDEDCESNNGASDRRELVNVDATGSRNRGSARGRWVFAAPIASLVGIALVLWLGNPLAVRRASVNRGDFPRGQHPSHGSVFSNPNQRDNNQRRRWWWLF